jgi:hypothetical protein
MDPEAPIVPDAAAPVAELDPAAVFPDCVSVDADRFAPLTSDVALEPVLELVVESDVMPVDPALL